MSDISKLSKAMADLEEDAVLEMIKEVVRGNGDATAALEGCQKGMTEVGDRFAAGEYYLSDLIFAGDLMTNAVELLKPVLGVGSAGARGKMVICTVKGDLHDIGKNIVKSLLEGAGFEVMDLGIDTDPEKIIETVKAHNIKIVALSGVLTLALDAMMNTVKDIKSAGLGDVKIIIGGNPVTEKACEVIGADDWAVSPQKTVDVCNAWAAA